MNTRTLVSTKWCGQTNACEQTTRGEQANLWFQPNDVVRPTTTWANNERRASKPEATQVKEQRELDSEWTKWEIGWCISNLWFQPNDVVRPTTTWANDKRRASEPRDMKGMMRMNERQWGWVNDKGNRPQATRVKEQRGLDSGWTKWEIGWEKEQQGCTTC
jgi:hypothetical protein